MSHPPTFKRIGELTDEILTHIEQIHKVKDDGNTRSADDLHGHVWGRIRAVTGGNPSPDGRAEGLLVPLIRARKGGRRGVSDLKPPLRSANWKGNAPR